MFQIRNDLDFDDFCDLYTLTHRGRPSLTEVVYFVYYLVFGLVAIWYLAFSFTEGSWYMMLLVACFVWLFYELLTRKKRTARRMLKKKERLELLNAELSVDEEGIRAEGDKLHRFYCFPWITGVVHGYGFYVLKGQGGSRLVMAERCFTEGDPCAFGEFLERKTGLKIKEYK